MVKHLGRLFIVSFISLFIISGVFAHSDELLPTSRARSPLLWYYVDRFVPYVAYVHKLERRWNIPATEEEYYAKLKAASEYYVVTGDPNVIEQVTLEGYKNKRITLRYPFTRDVLIYGVPTIMIFAGAIALGILIANTGNSSTSKL